MRALTKREKNILIICVVLGGAYFGYNGVYKPVTERLDYLDQKAVVLQKQIKKNREMIKNSEQVEKNYAEIVDRFKQVRSNEQEMSAILSEIEDVARGLEMQIADLKPHRVRSEANFNRFSVSLTLSSEISDIVQFIYELQKEPHFFNVEEVRFDKSNQRGKDSLKTSLVLSRFFIP